MKHQIITRAYQLSDAQALANIYYNTIHHVNKRDYSIEQINAWAPSSSLVIDGWKQKWEKLVPIVALSKNIIVGFAEFESNGHIDGFFVHHKFQGKGVGSVLMTAIEAIAKQNYTPRMDAEVSITAKSFFARKGFQVTKKQCVIIRGCKLTNFVMEKILVHSPEHLDIRLIKNEEDWLAFQNLRLGALQEHPEAFGSSYEEESIMSAESFKEGYKKCDIFGVFIEHALVGCAGFFVQSPLKMRHRGVLFSMYVAPIHRNKGIGNLLVKTVIDHSKNYVLQLHATVVTSNQLALNLYERNGFIIYGTEPRSLKIDNYFYDEHMMVLTF